MPKKPWECQDPHCDTAASPGRADRLCTYHGKVKAGFIDPPAQPSGGRPASATPNHSAPTRRYVLHIRGNL